VRAFIGLPVPEVLLAPLATLQGAISVGRAVPLDDLHLTLAFLGDISDPVAEEVHTALDMQRLPRCALAPGGLATYGGSPPRLLALEIGAEPALSALQAQVARAVAQAGVLLERRRFRPHVTLLRFGSDLGPGEQARLHRALDGLILPEMPAAETRIARFYRSHLGPQGARYDVLAEYLLV
jgi:2'-5' RNA ligase